MPRCALVEHLPPVLRLRADGRRSSCRAGHPQRAQPQWRQLTQPEARTSGPAHSGHTRTAGGGRSGPVAAGGGGVDADMECPSRASVFVRYASHRCPPRADLSRPRPDPVSAADPRLSLLAEQARSRRWRSTTIMVSRARAGPGSSAGTAPRPARPRAALIALHGLGRPLRAVSDARRGAGAARHRGLRAGPSGQRPLTGAARATCRFLGRAAGGSRRSGRDAPARSRPTVAAVPARQQPRRARRAGLRAPPSRRSPRRHRARSAARRARRSRAAARARPGALAGLAAVLARDRHGPERTVARSRHRSSTCWPIRCSIGAAPRGSRPR